MCRSWGRKTIYPESVWFPCCWSNMLWNGTLGTPEAGPILGWYKSSITPQRLIVLNCLIWPRLFFLSLQWVASDNTTSNVIHSWYHPREFFLLLVARQPATESPLAVSSLAFVSYTTNVVSLVSGFMRFKFDCQWYKLIYSHSLINADFHSAICTQTFPRKLSYLRTCVGGDGLSGCIMLKTHWHKGTEPGKNTSDLN